MSKQTDQSSVESGKRLMRGLLLTLAAFVVAMAGVAVMVFLGTLWLAVRSWYKAFLLESRLRGIQMREVDRGLA